MSKTVPNKAFILAAGLGSRLRPYTDNTPKPLVTVGGKTLLDRTLDHLASVNVNEIAANTHYLPDQIKAALATRPEFKTHISYEETLLDTGGGIKNLLAPLGNEAFYILSGDGLWENAANQNTLQAMSEAWNDETMDILMLLQPISSMKLTGSAGDYSLGSDGLPIRSPDKTGDYMFTSMRINHPRIFKNSPDQPFNYRDLMDEAQNKGRLAAIIHNGDWHHISTPADLEAVNTAYEELKEV